ncbi:MAG: SUMF1/EgtB/PvdO family nonheme iron enzyme [Chthoniobacterales bacterium]
MKILLVDDEAPVLEAWRELLASAEGCEIRVASNGSEALEVARAWGGADALVTDVVMEPMDGFALRETLVAEWPAVRAVFVSGYDLSGYAERTAGAVVLSKPLDLGRLACALGLPGAEGFPPVGANIGGYHLQEAAGQGGTEAEYLAWQQGMSRHVVLHVLDSTRGRDPAVVAAFLANARVKAAVTHPFLLAVHEAGEADGHFYYSSDLVPGHTLEAYAAAGQKLDDRVLMNALRAAGEVSDYFHKNNIARRALGPADVLLDGSMRPRLANLAVAGEAVAHEESAEVQVMAACLQGMAAPDGSASQALAMLAKGGSGWTAARALAAAAKPVAAPKDASQLTARTEKSKELLAKSKARQKKQLLITAALSLILLGLAVVLLLRTFAGSRGITTKSIEIPAGEFVYQSGEKVTLPAFSIDEHEVSIADYKEFLDFLKANPGEAAKLDHPDQPKGKSHVPLDWADNEQMTPPMPGYFTRAVRWKQYKDAPLSVDSPVFNVDWFDAYAYAKWKGRRLPTEQEWEKAARGTDGRKFPWGNEDDAKRVNSGADFKPNPKEGGEVDGFKRWSPVNQPEGDTSPFGLHGMAGNVSEWTATWAPSEDSMGGQVPVIRGGNWGNPEHNLTRRRAILDPLQVQDTLGFRTVSDNAQK